MEIQHYKRQKTAIERVQSEVCFDSAEHEQVRRFSSTVQRGKSAQFKIVFPEKERTGTWFSKQMGHIIINVSRRMTKKIQASVEQPSENAHHLNVDVSELLVSSK